jgi:drug/metabolite transporter (DMT)-like permease
LTSAALATAVILVSKQSVRVPRGEVRWMVLGMGVLDTGAFVRGNLGMKMEQVAVITVLSSLYGAVTVGLAAIFLKEHVSRWQWTGIVTIFAGIFLISQ